MRHLPVNDWELKRVSKQLNDRWVAFVVLLARFVSLVLRRSKQLEVQHFGCVVRENVNVSGFARLSAVLICVSVSVHPKAFF